MAFSFKSIGALVDGFNTSVTAAAPATFSAGDLLLQATGEYIGGDVLSTTLAGWSLLCVYNRAKQIMLWGKIAAGGDTFSAFSWGNIFAWAQAAAYGGPPSTLASILDAASTDWATTNNFSSPIFLAGTPTLAGSLAVAIGVKDKTSASDASTFTVSPSASPGPGFTMRSTNVPSGTNVVVCWADWIQTSAVPIGTVTFIGTVGDGLTPPPATEGLVSVFKPSGGGGGGSTPESHGAYFDGNGGTSGGF